MKIFELSTPSFKIYCDADGVLVDFDSRMQDIGFDPTTTEHDKKQKQHFWARVGNMAKNGIPFWEDMKKMPDADQLWNYIKKHGAEILTATGHVGNASEEKQRWFSRHYPGTKVILVRKSQDKAAYASPSSILIDDREKSIAPWVAAGGIGILHTSAADTIKQLQALGI